MSKKKLQENPFCSSVNSDWSKAVWHSVLEEKIKNKIECSKLEHRIYIALSVAQHPGLVYKNEEILQ